MRDINRVQGKEFAKNNGNKNRIVETSSTILKAEVLKQNKSFNIKNKRKLFAKHLGLTQSDEVSIFVSEQLTAKAARLLFLARDLSKFRTYIFRWASYGRVYVRKDDQSPKIAFKSEAQVQRLLLDT
ncbi:unnamed protein product [Euphydryas editha]|uniref:FP protein C-terminal domain-containing protein n=1 Tax=Euphydryas editha TaxID=104508 RepID=A0AAU9V418_EUPED|nr:unnamed protein product [Euphydryas editha]